MLYIARRVRDGAVKIGRSSCVERRLRDLARDYGSDFELLRTEDVADTVEQTVQHSLRRWATEEGREWFRPDAEFMGMVMTWPIDKLAATRQQRRSWRLPYDAFDRIKDACHSSGTSISTVIRKAIDRQVAHDEGTLRVQNPPIARVTTTSILVDDIQYAAATNAARVQGKSFSLWLLEAVDAWISQSEQERTDDIQ